MDLVSGLAVVASSVAAVLAWLAKLWWGREYMAAKEAQIQLLQREVEGLRQLSPMVIREYFLSVRQQLEEYNNNLKSQLSETRCVLEAKTREAAELRASGTAQSVLIQELEVAREEAQARVKSLESQMTGVTVLDEAATSATQLAVALASTAQPSEKAQLEELQRSLHRAVQSLVEAGGLEGQDIGARYREYKRRAK